MLAYEWRELEVLCDRISTLRHRYTAAQRSKNTGLIEGLAAELALVQRQREQLVQHIAARLGSVAAAAPAAGSRELTR
jgi:hypothetical protein